MTHTAHAVGNRLRLLFKLEFAEMCDLERKRVGFYLFSIAQQCSSFDHILQLSEVAVPYIVSKNILHFIAEPANILSQFRIGLVEEMIGIEHDVIRALAQRWN